MEEINGLLKSNRSLEIFLPFIPLFVAIDPFGILPVFFSLTSDIEERERRRVIRQSVLTAFLAGFGFLVAGRSVFRLLGISAADFQVAGGILLFILAIVDLIFPERTRTFPKETLGVVPIGIPLIVGPGALTLILMTALAYGYISTLLSFVLNLLIVGLVFNHSSRLMRVLKEGGTKGIAKVFALLLGAFAMMMIRTGVSQWLT